MKFPFISTSQVKEIQQEAAHGEPESVQQKDKKQTAAVGLSKRLKDFRAINDAASLKGTSDLMVPLQKYHRKYYLKIRGNRELKIKRYIIYFDSVVSLVILLLVKIFSIADLGRDYVTNMDMVYQL